MNIILTLGLFFTTEGAGAVLADKRVQLSTGNYRFVVVQMFAKDISLICPVLWKSLCLGLTPKTTAKAREAS